MPLYPLAQGAVRRNPKEPAANGEMMPRYCWKIELSIDINGEPIDK